MKKALYCTQHPKKSFMPKLNAGLYSTSLIEGEKKGFLLSLSKPEQLHL